MQSIAPGEGEHNTPAAAVGRTSLIDIFTALPDSSEDAPGDDIEAWSATMARQAAAHERIARFEVAAAPAMTAAQLRTLPAALGNMVAAVTASAEVAAVMPTWAGLATASAMVAGRLTVCYAGRDPAHVNVFLMTLAEPGLRKSGVFELMTAPLRDLEVEEQQSARVAVGLSQSAARQRQSTIRRLEEQLASGKLTSEPRREAEAELRRLVEEHELTPVLQLPRRVDYGNTTPEQLARNLAAHGRWAVLADEGEILDASTKYAANGVSNTDIFLSAWDARGGTIERVKEQLIIPRGATLTVGVFTQPARFREFMADQRNIDRGLVQRFLLITAERGDGVPATRTPSVPGAVRTRWAEALRFLDTVTGELSVPDGTPAGNILHAEERANVRMLKRGGFYDEHGDVATQWGMKLIQSGTVRMLGVLAALFAFDANEGPNAAAWSSATLERAAQAAVVLTQLTRAHTLAAYGTARGGSVVADALNVLNRYIARLDNPHSTWTRRDVLRKAQRVYDAPALAAALDELYERRYILLADPEKDALDARGRLKATARLTLHPDAFASNTTPAQPDTGAVYQAPAADDTEHSSPAFTLQPSAQAGCFDILDSAGVVVRKAVPSAKVERVLRKLEAGGAQ